MEFYLGILLGLIALCAIVWAFVRRRVGDEPHCRRCGFSLAGLTEPAVCPECGRPLHDRRSITRGHRRSRRRPLFWFAATGFLSLVLFGLSRANATGFIPLNSYKPSWILLSEVAVLPEQRSNWAIEELLERKYDGTLDQKDWDRLVGFALDRHAQTWRSLPGLHWEVITNALVNREMTTPQIELLLKNTIEDVKIVRQELRLGGNTVTERRCEPGEEIFYQVRVGYRVGQLNTNQGIGLQLIDTGASVSAYIKNVGGGGESLGVRYMSPYSRLTRVGDHGEVALHAPVEPGVYDGFVRYEMSGKDLLARASDIEFGSSIKSDFRVVSMDMPFRLEVVETDSQSFPVLDLDELGRDPRSLISVKQKPVISWSVGRSQTAQLEIGLGPFEGSDPSRVGLAGQIVARQDGVQTRSTMHIDAGSAERIAFVDLSIFRSGTVHLTYEHNESIAAEHLEHAVVVLGGPIDLGTIELSDRSPIRTIDGLR